MSDEQFLRDVLTDDHPARPGFRAELREVLVDEWHGRAALTPATAAPRRRAGWTIGAAAAAALVVAGLMWSMRPDDPAPPVDLPPAPDATVAPSTPPPPTTVPDTTTPSAPVAADVARLALLTADDLGDGWVEDTEPPAFLFDPALVAGLDECRDTGYFYSNGEGNLWDDIAQTSVATVRISRGEAGTGVPLVNEYVIVFADWWTVDAVMGEIVGWQSGHAHAPCFSELRDWVDRGSPWLTMFGVDVEATLGGGGRFAWEAVEDGELRTTTESAAAAFRVDTVIFLLEMYGVDQPAELVELARTAAAGRLPDDLGSLTRRPTSG